MNIEVKKDLWTHLKETDKPILMYGMGNGADKILAVCEKYGIEISALFAGYKADFTKWNLYSDFQFFQFLSQSDSK